MDHIIIHKSNLTYKAKCLLYCIVLYLYIYIALLVYVFVRLAKGSRIA